MSHPKVHKKKEKKKVNGEMVLEDEEDEEEEGICVDLEFLSLEHGAGIPRLTDRDVLTVRPLQPSIVA